MKRWLPSPWMSLVLLLFWLLLNESLEPAHLLLGAILAVVVPLLTRPLQPMAYPRIAKPFKLFRLLAMALVEIVRSCFNVSWLILFTPKSKLNSQFIKIPLDMHNPYGLALLSCLINSTPGTVWVEILPEKHELALHVFDLHDEQWWIETIKTQYEQPLMEIFEQEKTA
ncbi:Na+/H+ antiporter subunit E [Herminiimonas fonticola]|uniref:Multisubunit potassium/proton antiporter PhaE subunit n=1 Tax=Herminiimonas fonticola TaxID=303380 RepID=A0A4R6GI25_9BURK|nr:Na+/H+ antiporter subunit E [Herminiimonas fonticola]RBA24926.1 Multisubunit Na+/H+ antiporter MnhE subunit [Herminiimonas fonticola]TDN94040.1 multisubunit potassium/proton antiporter PhaE subunit [Herminiimonas fonticola]